MDIETINQISPNHITQKYFSKHFPEDLEKILNYPIGNNFSEKLYNWIYHIQQTPVCEICGAPVKFVNARRGYRKYCSQKCVAISPERKTKIFETKSKKYGDPCYNNRELAKKTCLEKYGAENPFQSDEIKEKIKQGYQQKYGVDYPSQSVEIQKIRQKNSLEKYGVDHHMKLEEVRQKVLKSNHSNFIENDPNLLGYDEDGNRIMKCPHPNCDKCREKTYSIFTSNYFSRKEFDIEPCTKILPVKFGRNKDTIIERFVKNILEENNIQYISNDRSILSDHKELDIYIPDHNMAIECNGMFWHSSYNKSRNFHYEKFLQCKDKGIFLFTLWEDQIKYHPEIVRSMILSKLNIYKTKIYARKCCVKSVDYKEANEFLKDHHIQGSTKFTIALGLYHNGLLVSLMTFCKRSKLSGNKQEDNLWDLNRFCNKIDISVIGAAGKLLKFFIDHYKNTYNIDGIISFASNDISDGNLYKTLGFKELDHSLSYWYVHKTELIRYHRTNFTKSRLKKMGYDYQKSESEIMSELPYYKIYDCGHTKYILDI